MAITGFIIFSLFLWAFIGYLVARDTNIGFEGESSPYLNLELKDGVNFNGLVKTQGNSLLPMSYLPNFMAIEVRSVIVSEPIDYCGTEWLSQFWQKDLILAASKICQCESRGDPNRINDGFWGVKEYAVSLFQINILAHKSYNEDWLKIPENNVKTAVKIYQENGGWKNWLNCAKQTGVLP